MLFTYILLNGHNSFLFISLALDCSDKAVDVVLGRWGSLENGSGYLELSAEVQVQWVTLVLVGVLLLWRYRDRGHSYEWKHLIGACVQMKDLVHCRRAGRHSAGEVVWAVFIYIYRQHIYRRVSHWAWLELPKPQSPSCPQWHTPSIKATPILTRSHLLNGVTPCVPSIQTHESKGPNLFKPLQCTSMAFLLYEPDNDIKDWICSYMTCRIQCM